MHSACNSPDMHHHHQLLCPMICMPCQDGGCHAACAQCSMHCMSLQKLLCLACYSPRHFLQNFLLYHMRLLQQELLNSLEGRVKKVMDPFVALLRREQPAASEEPARIGHLQQQVETLAARVVQSLGLTPSKVQTASSALTAALRESNMAGLRQQLSFADALVPMAPSSLPALTLVPQNPQHQGLNSQGSGGRAGQLMQQQLLQSPMQLPLPGRPAAALESSCHNSQQHQHLPQSHPLSSARASLHQTRCLFQPQPQRSPSQPAPWEKMSLAPWEEVQAGALSGQYMFTAGDLRSGTVASGPTSHPMGGGPVEAAPALAAAPGPALAASAAPPAGATGQCGAPEPLPAVSRLLNGQPTATGRPAEDKYYLRKEVASIEGEPQALQPLPGFKAHHPQLQMSFGAAMPSACSLCQASRAHFKHCWQLQALQISGTNCTMLDLMADPPWPPTWPSMGSRAFS